MSAPSVLNLLGLSMRERKLRATCVCPWWAEKCVYRLYRRSFVQMNSSFSVWRGLSTKSRDTEWLGRWWRRHRFAHRFKCFTTFFHTIQPGRGVSCVTKNKNANDSVVASVSSLIPLVYAFFDYYYYFLYAFYYRSIKRFVSSVFTDRLFPLIRANALDMLNGLFTDVCEFCSPHRTIVLCGDWLQHENIKCNF